jgi:serine/threonine protein kinase
MAQHKRTKAKVAIKQIDRKVCPAELLVKEVNIMAKLKGCSGVIHLIEVYEEPEKPFTHLVMELVTGGELFDYIVKSSSYSEKSASDYIRQLCQTVEYLHSKNIVHRDLKPENMLFEDQTAQVLKLCDFGLADTLKDDFDFLTLAVGTKSYMAPEVSSGMGYGKPVDMYSIGVILYILLCGYLPIDPENGIYVLEFPPSEWSGISFEVKLLIKKLLDDSPAARPTATQVLKHPWIRGTNTSTKPLVGTVRNLKSWNQVGGRAITKPRGQVMNLFDNPPAASSSNEGSPTSAQAPSAVSPKAKRAASPKPKVTKAKKAAIPKLVDGVLVTAPTSTQTPETPTSNPTTPSKGSKTKSNKDGTPKQPKPATTDAQLSLPSTGPSSSSANDSSSSSSRSTADNTDAKPAATRSKRKTDRPVRDAPRSPSRSSTSKSPSAGKVKASDQNINSTEGASISSPTSGSSGPSTPSKSAQTTKSERSTISNGESKPSNQISDRTKKFLQEQEDRDAAKKAESDEKKKRRRSVGGPTAKRARVENDEKVESRAAGAKGSEQVEKVRDKKERNGETKEKKEGSGDKREKDAISADASVASGAPSKSSKASNVAAGASSKGDASSPDTMASRAAQRKSMREFPVDPTDLTALIASALSDDEDTLARRRSSSATNIVPVQKPRRPKTRDPGLVGGSGGPSNGDEEISSPKASRKSGRDRSATTQDAAVGDFSSFGSDSVGVPASAGNGSKLKIVTATRHMKAGTDQTGSTTIEEYYPRRSSSKPSGLSAKKANRMSMGSPTQSPKRSRPATPAVGENGVPTSPSTSRTGARRAGSPKVPRKSASKDVLPVKTSPKQKRRDDSDSESYGTGQSNPGTPIDDNFKVLLDTQSSDATDDAPAPRKKKVVPMRHISSLSSDSD